MDHNSNKFLPSPHKERCFDELIFEVLKITDFGRCESTQTKTKPTEDQHTNMIEKASKQSYTSEVISQPLFPETAEQSVVFTSQVKKKNRMSCEGKENSKRCKNPFHTNEFLNLRQSENVNVVNADYKKSSILSDLKVSSKRNLHNINANTSQSTPSTCFEKLLQTSQDTVTHDLCLSYQEELKSSQASKEGKMLTNKSKIRTNKSKTIKHGGNKPSREFFASQKRQVSSQLLKLKEPVDEIIDSDVSFIEQTPTETNENSFIMNKLTSFKGAKIKQIDEKVRVSIISKNKEKLGTKSNNVTVSNKYTKVSEVAYGSSNFNCL